MVKYAVIIAAGGQGTRFGGDKQFFEIKGQPLIVKTLKKFQKGFEQIIVVCGQKDQLIDLLKKYQLRVDIIVASGNQRYDSISNGLKVLNSDIDYVLIHDGARPNISANLITKIKKAVLEKKAVIPVVKLKDTVKVIDSQDVVVQTPDRNSLVAVQTPQAFAVDLIKKAYQLPKDQQITDDACLVECLGVKVFTVEGSEDNLKITTKKDLKYL